MKSSYEGEKGMKRNLSAIGVLLILISSTVADSSTIIPTALLMIAGAILAILGARYVEA